MSQPEKDRGAALRRWLDLRANNAELPLEEFCRRFPEVTDAVLDDLIAEAEDLEGRGEVAAAEQVCDGCTELGLLLAREWAKLRALSAAVFGEAASAEAPPRPTEAEAVTRYHALTFHERGGMGEVFRGESQEGDLRRQVAVKILRADLANGPHEEQFRLEAEITAVLDHPGIAPVHALGHTKDGRPFYAMRFFQGQTLDERIAEFHKWHQALKRADRARAWRGKEFLELCNRFVAVCRTVAYAHDHPAGVILHRDLKPRNVMLGAYGETVVLDWGLTRPLPRDGGALPAVETQGRNSPGTQGYMSPEQSVGHPDHLRPTTDVYSLGASFYKMLTGRAPAQVYRGKEATFVAHGFRRPRELDASIPRALEAVCLKAMARPIYERYPTATALADDLEYWLAELPVQAAPEPLADRVARLARRHRAWVRAGAVALAMVAGACVVAAALIARASHDLAEERQRRLDATTSEVNALQDALRRRYDRAIALTSSAYEVNDLMRAEEFLAECPVEQRSFEWYLLKRMCHPDKLRLHHPDVVLAGAFSPDRRLLATACGDKAIRLFEMPSGRLVRALQGHKESATAVAFDPKSERIYSANGAGELRCWNVADGEPVWTRRAHRKGIRSFVLHPNGKHLLSGGEDGRLLITDVKTGKLLKEAVGSEGAITALALHKDGKTLAVGERFPDSPTFPKGPRFPVGPRNGSVRLWNLDELTTGNALGGAVPFGVNTLTFNAFGDELWVLDRKGAVHFRVVATGKDRLVTGGEENFTATIASSPTGQQGAFANAYHHTITLADREAQISRPLNGHADLLAGLRFSDDGKWLVSVSGDRTARVWEVEDPTFVHHPASFKFPKPPIYAVDFSRDNRYLLTAGKGQHLHLWDMEKRQMVSHLYQLRCEAATAAAFHPTGNCVAVGFDNGVVRVIDVPDFRTSRYIQAEEHGGLVAGLVWTETGRELVTAAEDGKVIFWRMNEPEGDRKKATLDKVAEVAVSRGAIHSLAYAPEQGWLATGGDDGQIHVLDAARREVLHRFDAKTSQVTALAFHSDGRLFSAGVDGMLRSWEAKGGKLLRETRSHRQAVRSLAVSPDGKRVASSGEVPDPTVQLWDVESGQKVLTLRGPTLSVLCLAFSADGHWLVSGSYNGVAKLWDARPMLD
jgi:eukaryotic-like serine/threonine-protein kinase